ncbi:polysaccharide deacetylase family protein [Streptomyces sp. NPDC046900]|uniref:polysaccharide deacetylase family protein n=1 Tax=Streptomyces sp. NPDC046900 TaxID=3155473 RepID=UPI003406A5AF
MARHLFGLSPADITVSQSGTSLVLEPGSTGTAWDSRTGGTQLTDLTDLSGNPITTVTSDTYSTIGFYGPDGVTNLYLDFGFAGGRTLMQATDLGAAIEDLQTNKLDVAADLRSGGTITGDLAVSGRLSASGFALPLIPPFTRRPAWRDGSIVTMFQSGHGWTVGSGTGSASHVDPDTSDFVKGTQAVKVTTAGNASQSQVRRSGMAPMDLTNKAIRLVIKFDAVTNLDRINFYVGTSNFTNFFQWTPHTHSTTTSQNWISDGEWVTLTFGWPSVVSASGSYTLSSTKVPSTTTGFTDMQIAVYDNGTGPVTYHVQSIDIIDGTSATFPSGVCSITFDDSYQSVFDYARPKMDALGYRGTNYTIVGNLGSPSYLTATEVRQLQDVNGWEIGAHSYDPAVHTNRYTSYTAAEVDMDLAKSRAWLVSNGLTGDGVAYPGGNFWRTTDNVSIEGLVAKYFSHGRSITGQPESAAPPMPYRLRAQTGINDGTALGGITVSQLTVAGGPLDQCANGTWLILAFHKIVTTTPAASTECSQTGFNTVMDAIAARGIKVLPVSDVLRYYS